MRAVEEWGWGGVGRKEESIVGFLHDNVLRFIMRSNGEEEKKENKREVRRVSKTSPAPIYRIG